MKSKIFNPNSYCGLFCASCPVFMATEDRRVGEFGGHTCNGCKSDNVSGWCATCEIKSCCRDKSIESCVQCSDYPCEILEEFKNDPNCEYHTEIYDSLKILKETGEANWIKSMNSRWRCSSCNSRYNWWETKCRKCSSVVAGYSRA